VCGRFTLLEADKILAKEFGISAFPSLSPRCNITPSQPVAAVVVPDVGPPVDLALLAPDRFPIDDLTVLVSEWWITM
jgi:putative SOS response-associated peptidase YedK